MTGLFDRLIWPGGGGAHCAPCRALFFGNYWTNQSEILHSYCLDLSEEHLLGSEPKHPEFPGKFRKLTFSGMSGILIISVSLLMNINIYALISIIWLGITLKSTLIEILHLFFPFFVRPGSLLSHVTRTTIVPR